jgi:hypothetical protein
MGFQQILDRWQADGRTTHASHSSLALATFRTTHPQVFANLDEDGNIEQGYREELLGQLLNAHPHDLGVVRSKMESFCRSHQGLGTENAAARHADLGHVEDRSKTERALASVARPTSGVTVKDSGALVIDKIVRLDLAGQRRLLKGFWLSKYQMWSFYRPRTRNDPFQGLSLRARSLRRRLGLGQIDPTTPLLLWVHQLRSDQVARTPTTFDSEINEFYRPGGKTQPLTGSGGLNEVVHPPVTGDQLTLRIQRAL